MINSLTSNSSSFVEDVERLKITFRGIGSISFSRKKEHWKRISEYTLVPNIQKTKQKPKQKHFTWRGDYIHCIGKNTLEIDT